MRISTIAFLLPICLLQCASGAEASDTCVKAFERSLRPGSVLALDLRAGDIDIVGSDSSTLRVTCDTPNFEDMRRISIDYDSSGPKSKLRIYGGPYDKTRILIEVPRRMHLSVRCTAGDVDIRGISGDKDVRLMAGDLKIAVGDPSDYSDVETSVKAGDLNLTAFGTHKGGLLRSYRKRQRNGSYTLRAHLWAGNVTLR